MRVIRGARSPIQEDHALLCDAVRKAGAVVAERYRGHPVRQWAKDDHSPVTEADLQANEILKTALIGARPDYGWLSEECPDDKDRLAAERTFIVDPIDGTRSFIEGKPEFTVCAAMVAEGLVRSAAIYNPITDEFFDAIKGGGARCNGDPIHAAPRDQLKGSKMLGSGPMFKHPGWPSPWPKLELGYRNSTSYRCALVAKGVVHGTLALVPKADWDAAPGALIAEEAGAKVTDHLGTPFVFNRPDALQRALVCMTEGLHREVLDRLAHLPNDLTRIKP